MAQQVIPAQAVEAAVEAYRREFPYDENEGYVVKLILEAAAPHMLAGAWESGWANARANYLALHRGQEIPEWVTLRNPYRTTK